MLDNAFTRRFARGLIVSCQAQDGEPFDDPLMLAAFAKCAKIGGAVGIRANGAGSIAAIAQAVDLPIIGIVKRPVAGERVYITPSFEDAQIAARAGSACIALEVSSRPHPKRPPLKELFDRIHGELNCLIMADISTLEEGIRSAEAGADAIGTTLSGYTPESPKLPGPDLELVRRLCAAVKLPVIAEGRYNTPELSAQAIEAGAYGVVVGEGITRPHKITERFVRSMQTLIK